MTRPLSALFIIAAAALGLGAAIPAMTAAQSPAPSASAAPAKVIHIKDFAFAPTSLTVSTGDAVQFINDDAAAHTATASDKSFDSGNLDQKATWTYTFAKPGTYAYVCTYHASMKGQITVQDAK